MRDLLTPKQVARALDVSESSIKRWCDGGIIPTQYTAGGHRRIAVSAVLEFARSGSHQVLRPEALGLPSTSGRTERNVKRACAQMTEALIEGEESRCRQIAVDLYLADHSLSVICDDVLSAAFREIGDRWACGAAEIYQERRGCVIALRVIEELHSLLPPLPPGISPTAIGGASAGDQYNLGTSMAELVLSDSKWDARSLGSNLPFETLAAAIRDHHPKLFWMSCTHIADRDAFITGYNYLYDEFATDVAFVVGGFALDEDLRERMKYAAYCDNMKHLEGFAQTLRGALEQDKRLGIDTQTPGSQ